MPERIRVDFEGRDVRRERKGSRRKKGRESASSNELVKPCKGKRGNVEDADSEEERKDRK